MMSGSYYFVRKALSMLMTTMKVQPFVTLTVDEYIWGYDDAFYKLAMALVPREMRYPKSKFGVLAEVSSYTLPIII